MVSKLEKTEAREIPAYDIGILVLDKIPLLERDYQIVEVYDLSVTQISIPKTEKRELINNTTKTKKLFGRKNEEYKTIFTPEIIFKLIDNNNKVSLIECLLPSHQLLASKCELIQDECIKEMRNGDEIYTKIVYELNVFTRRGLEKTTQTYEQYQQDIANIRASHKRELENMRNAYQERVETVLEPYIKNEERLRQRVNELNSEINTLIMDIPDSQNQKILEFVMKSNNAEGILKRRRL